MGGFFVLPREVKRAGRDAGGTGDAFADLFPSCGAAGCGEVEAIQVHHLGPGCREILDEFGVRVGASVDF
jgi:hypothetical protein